MARNTTFTFGLFSFAAKVDGAVQTAESMSNLCQGQPGKDAHDPLPVKQPKVCTTCGVITDLTVLVKGVKRGSAYTLVSQDDVAAAKAEFTQEYKGKFEFAAHPAHDVLSTTAPGDSLNYITPADASGQDHYQLMLKLVKEHPEVAFVALHTPASATNLFMLSARGNTLVVEKRVRSQSLKPEPSVGGTVNETLYAMLETTLDKFITPYDPEAYEDKYAEAIRALAETGETVTVGAAIEAKPAAKSDDDIMAKLQALAGGKPAAKPRKRATKKAASVAA